MRQSTKTRSISAPLLDIARRVLGTALRVSTVSRRALLLVLVGVLLCAAAVVVTPTGIDWVGDGSVGDMYTYCDGADLGDVGHHRWVNTHRWRNAVCGDARDQTRAAVTMATVGGVVASAGGMWLLVRRLRRRSRWQQGWRRAMLWLSPPVAIIDAAAAGAVLPLTYVELLL